MPLDREPRQVYTVRLLRAERRLLEAAALRAREHTSEYMRRVALAAARQDLAADAQPR